MSSGRGQVNTENPQNGGADMSQPTPVDCYEQPMIDESGRSLLDDRPGRHRHHDHATSIAGARSVSYRATSQKAALLAAYGDAPQGMTDEEAALAAGLPARSCWWKRSSELRQDSMIAPVEGPGGPLKRLGSAGDHQMVCAITEAGRAVLGAL